MARSRSASSLGDTSQTFSCSVVRVGGRCGQTPHLPLTDQRGGTALGCGARDLRASLPPPGPVLSTARTARNSTCRPEPWPMPLESLGTIPGCPGSQPRLSSQRGPPGGGQEERTEAWGKRFQARLLHPPPPGPALPLGLCSPRADHSPPSLHALSAQSWQPLQQ